MLTAVSIIVTLFIAVLGFLKPRIMGWVVLALSPVVAGFWGLTFIPDTILPLRITQVIMAMSLGLLFSGNNWLLVIGFLSRSRIAQCALVFLLTMFCTSLQNIDQSFLKFFFFQYVPQFFSAIIIGFLVVKDDKSFNSLVTIFAYSALIISIFSVIEYFNSFNIYNWLYINTSPTVNFDNMQLPLYQVDVLRVVGTEGDPISTGQKLSFLLPFVILHLSRKTFLQKVFYGWVPLIATLIGIILCMSRAVYIGLAFGLLAGMMLSKRVSKIGFQLIVCLVFLFLVVPTLNDIGATIWNSRIVNETFKPLAAGEDIDVRVEGSRLALSLFVDSPIYGHGSWEHVYNNLLDYMDAPPMLLYLASGGLVLGLSFALLMFGLVISVLLRLNKAENMAERLNILTVLFATGIGITPLLFNNTDKILYIVILTYSAFFRVFIFNKRACVVRLHQAEMEISKPMHELTGVVL